VAGGRYDLAELRGFDCFAAAGMPMIIIGVRPIDPIREEPG